MKPRITMLTTFYPPYNFGGDGIGVQRLSTALAKRGFNITVVHNANAYLMQAKKEPAPAAPPPDGIRVVPLENNLGNVADLITHQTGRPLAHHSQLKRLLSPEMTDITWFHNVSLVGGPGLLSYGSGLKVYEAHEHWLVCPSHVLWRFDRELCDARQCTKCVLSYKRPPQVWRSTGFLDRQAHEIDLFIAKSEFSRAKHAEFGFKQDMKVAPYFLPEVETQDVAAAPAHDKPFFLFVGRLEKIKGVQDIIPAFAGDNGPDLVIIGDGEYAATLREQAKGMARVKFLGRKPPGELPPYYRDALALITPSLCFETFGIVLIEAFRLGLPVIARRLGPFPEIIDKARAGLLFETAAELQAAINVFQSDPARREEMSKAAKRSFAENWSESAVMRRYFDLLEEAARKKGLTKMADVFKERSAS